MTQPVFHPNGHTAFHPTDPSIGYDQVRGAWSPPPDPSTVSGPPSRDPLRASFAYRPGPTDDDESSAPAEWEWRGVLNRLRLARLRPGAAELAHRRAVRAI